MGLFRPTGMNAVRAVAPGDVMASGETFGALSADANSTIPGAAIAGGLLHRTGMTAGRTDTTDTAENILLAMQGNDVDRSALIGLAFRFTYIQTVAFATTWAHGRGNIAGLGTLNVAASTIRDFLVRILNATREANVAGCVTHNGTKAIEIAAPYAERGTITPGMMITGAGITAGTRVVGVSYGDQAGRGFTDKICAITTDTNSTADATGVALTFSPVLEWNSVGSKTL